MKRLFAMLIALALMLALPLAFAQAVENGELLIASEKVTGAVGDIVKVNFYLYPNFPDTRKLDSLQGSMKYDPEFLTFGTINQVDEENNLTSLMKGKASYFQFHEENKGEVKFGFIDMYGVEEEGFWFQAEFRIEKEGATDFIFNGVQYSGVDSEYKAVTYTIEPVSVGGVYTEGQEVPANDPPEETFAPLEPVVETPAPATPTPRPSNSGQSVPVVSTLPTISGAPTGGSTGLVTPPPAQTPMAPASYEAATPATTPAPETTEGPVAEASAEASAQAGDPTVPGSETALPIGEDPTDPGTKTDPQNPSATDPSAKPVDGENEKVEPAKKDNTTLLLIIAGGALVLMLGALAVVLILKRRNSQD